MAASGDLPDLFQMSEAYQIYWNEEGAYAKMDDDWYKEDEKSLITVLILMMANL